MKSTEYNLSQILFWVVGIFSFIIRAIQNFSQELLMGNGGYYPLQVRTVLERGELAFPDMPFLFYFDAGIVRLLSVFGISETNELIINVVKTVDCLSVPLLLIPLFQLFKLSKNTKVSYYFLSILAFAVLSFYTLNLTSSFQKNALGITFLLFAIVWFLKYLESTYKKHLTFAFIFLVFTGLTHFGTFSFALLLGIVFLLFRYKKKAILPILVLGVGAISIIYLFDPVRSSRLLNAWQGLFSKLPHPMIYFKIAIYLAVAIWAFRVFKKAKSTLSPTEKAIISTLISLLIIVPFPFLDSQISDRLSGFLFIPIVLLLFRFDPLISQKTKKILSVLLGIISLGSICFVLMINPNADVSKMALDDMENMKKFIPNPDETVVVARHNLEFWVAWGLKVDVSQESKFNDTLINEYRDVFIINQIREERPRESRPEEDEHKPPNHMQEPSIPENSTLVYSSEYFKLYRFERVH